ncbi:Torsin-like protein [Labeo rohita]|uniref:Torsin-like protein n=1 Tax=Labeo rohita TaxID=84645 RepID=A0ABQ8L2C1_LABRO|nr:Torsin-like protein [Labeo rohita]
MFFVSIGQLNLAKTELLVFPATPTLQHDFTIQLVAARIKFKTLMLAYRTATGSAPTYLHSLLPNYTPSRSLRSTSQQRLVAPPQRGTKSLSRTFSFTVPGWWNDLTPLSGMPTP